MSNILSYNNKTAKTVFADWVEVEPYSNDEINAIRDPNGGMSTHPRTAIPSPFAQVDLVKKAFENLAQTPTLDGAAMDHRLVSDALDIAQIFFDYENHKQDLRIVCWDRDEQLARLEADPKHNLYGQTLRLFLESDRAYNFDRMKQWYILLDHSRVIGGTSPASLTMAAPLGKPMPHIMIEQGACLFGEVRHLWQRDAEFVYYFTLLFNAFPELRRLLGGVYAYILRNLTIMQQQRRADYARIAEVIPNPSAMVEHEAPNYLMRLNMEFDPFPALESVSVLGARFFTRRSRNILQSAKESDFVIAPTKAQNADDDLPLVLVEGFNGQIGAHKYIDKIWNSATVVRTGNLPVNQRTLPDTSIQYPFITSSDLLTSHIVRLSTEVDGNKFIDGRYDSASHRGFLLPLTPLFFKYFSAADLDKDVFGKPMLQISERHDGNVLVTLRIPIKKEFIEVSRTYTATTAPQAAEHSHGVIVDIQPMNIALFPFVRTGNHDSYTLQLFSLAAQGNTSLRFLRDDYSESGVHAQSGVRSTGAFTTEYFDIDGSFDIIEVTVTTQSRNYTALAIPRWQEYRPSQREYIFAVDFGTTNSHVEFAAKGEESQPLTLTDDARQSHIATLLKKGRLDLSENLIKVEFVPRDIDSLYGFPLRTALAENESGACGNSLFADINIPFLYERKYFAGYNIRTGLKWMETVELTREFLREIMLCIRAKALLLNADPRNIDIVYFFPTSMSGTDRRRLFDVWQTLYDTYLGGDSTERLHAYPESVAPAFLYADATVSGGSYVSIDIGGGSSDVVVYQPSDDRLHSLPVQVSSFRFAGDALFGDGFASTGADKNPLVQHYVKYFHKLIARNPEVDYINTIIDDVCRRNRSADINAMLFSVECVEELRQLRELDRKIYSYNDLLRSDECRRVIFIYFYAAIIYYVAQSMHSRHFSKPKQIYFSGTGSKILRILGDDALVEELSQKIIEQVYQEAYNERFIIKVEKQQPKQITCRGGIKLENKRLVGDHNQSLYTPRNVNRIKHCHSMTDQEQLTPALLVDNNIAQQLIDSVKQFNDFFVNILDRELLDDFGIDKAVMEIFKKVASDDLPNYLTAGINAYIRGRYDADDVIDDAPFFYPIIGVIRHNLLPALSYQNINNRNNE